MIAVMISSKGSSWSFFAQQGDKIFLVENARPAEYNRDETLQQLVRDARWMFGNYRIVYFDHEDEWIEVLHDGAGNLKSFERYDGPVPVEMGYEINNEEAAQ